MIFGIPEIKEFAENHDDDRVVVMYRKLLEARGKNAKWAEANVRLESENERLKAENAELKNRIEGYEADEYSIRRRMYESEASDE